MHVHVAHPDGEVKFWLSPDVEFATQTGLSAQQIREAERVVRLHFEEIRNAWNEHFGS